METAAIAFLSALAGGLLAMLGNLVVANRASEHRIREARYSQVYAKRLELVAELYKRIVQAQSAVDYGLLQTSVRDLAHRLEEKPDVQRTLNIEQDEAQRRAWMHIGELVQFYQQHRIYFTGPIAATADALFPLLGHSLAEGKMDTSEDAPYGRLTALRADLQRIFQEALDLPDG